MGNHNAGPCRILRGPASATRDRTARKQHADSLNSRCVGYLQIWNVGGEPADTSVFRTEAGLGRRNQWRTGAVECVSGAWRPFSAIYGEHTNERESASVCILTESFPSH